jgi:protein-arginine kinase activator protein McsA
LAHALEARLRALHTELQEAVKTEDFEHAAALRDEITNLEANNNL